MPITTTIDKDAGIRTHYVKGILTFEELSDSLNQIYCSPEYDPELNVLWDLRAADVSSFTTKEIEQLASLVASQWGSRGKGRAALVVSGDHEYGLSRMYEMMSHETTTGRIMVFRELSMALEWLTEHK